MNRKPLPDLLEEVRDLRKQLQAELAEATLILEAYAQWRQQKPVSPVTADLINKYWTHFDRISFIREDIKFKQRLMEMLTHLVIDIESRLGLRTMLVRLEEEKS